MTTKPQIGAERYLLERIDVERVRAMARKAGWQGDDDNEGLREFCEPEDAALYSTHGTLAEAEQAARAWLATGRSFFGCANIDHQRFEVAVRGCPPEWDCLKSYEVAMDGETIEVES